jgi:hypothetical protein
VFFYYDKDLLQHVIVENLNPSVKSLKLTNFAKLYVKTCGFLLNMVNVLDDWINLVFVNDSMNDHQSIILHKI